MGVSRENIGLDKEMVGGLNKYALTSQSVLPVSKETLFFLRGQAANGLYRRDFDSLGIDNFNSILAELVRLLLHGHLLQAGDGEGKVVVVQDAREEGLSKPSPEQNNQH